MKKLLIMLISLISVISIGSAFNNNTEMKAAGNYQSGGAVTGRINKAPSGISGDNIGLAKGDKVYIGVNNPKDNTPTPLGWQLIFYDQGYEYYKVSPNGDGTNEFVQDTPISSWLSMTTKNIGTTYAFEYPVACPNGQSFTCFSSIFLTNYFKYVTNLNSNLSGNPLVTYRDLTMARDILECNSSSSPLNGGIHERIENEIRDGLNGKISFIMNLNELYGDAMCSTHNCSLKIPNIDLMFSENYFSAGLNMQSSTSANQSVIDMNTGMQRPQKVNEQGAVRPTVMLDLKDIVFAVSQGSSNAVANVSEYTLPSSYTSLYNETKNNPEMKLRKYKSSMSATLNGIQGRKGNSATKVANNQSVFLQANANAGNDGTGGTYTVSALVFDQNNKFKYYKPLESAKGNGSYEFNVTGIPNGTYKIAIVNEAYNDSSTAPADSSLISAVKTLTIVNPLTITATASTGLEYGKNVNQNDTVATYSTSNGADPITTTLESDTSVSGHSNDYQLFSLNNGKVIVKNASGLNAGDYYFKIKAIDSNGDPNGGIYTNTIHVNVAKTDTTIAFDDPNETKKSAVSAAANTWFETATATPTTDTKIIYDISGGKSTLINIDSNTGEITYTGNGDYGKVEIRATVDDDPATGNNNYNSKETRKEIFIYREVNANVIPDSNSSNTAIPAFSASDPNVKTNGTIGTIIGTDGTPDNITSGGTTYTYKIKSGAGDGNLFLVDHNGVIQAAADLGVKSYSFTITVSDKFSSKDIDVTVNVGTAPAEDLSFYETSAAINRITQKSVKATDTNIIVYATVKGSTNTNQVKYKIKDGSTNVIDVNPISGAVTIHGVGTVTIVAEKDGESGQAKAQAELEFTVTAGEQNFIYVDNANNELPKTGTIYNAYQEVYEPSKTFQLYTAGNPTGSTVTYQLKAGSPTDVINVDNNGLVTILNASLNNQMGKVIVQATSHDPSGNYSDKTIELPINIEKGTRTITFAENPIYVSNGKGKVTPVTEVDGATDTDGDVLIEVDSNEDHTIAWTNDNKTIDYNYSGQNGIDIKIHATKPMDRNYKAAEADGMIHIMGPDENILAITSPGQIIYGDRFTIRSSQYDADSTNVQYTFEVDDTTYISTPTVSGNSAQFDAIKYSGTNKTTITVTRTADGETPLSKNISVQVLPKEIEIVIDDQEKLKGEQNPTLTYHDFRNQLVSWNGIQDIIQENDIKLNTTAKTDSNAGSYPIKGDSITLNKTYPNYNFSFKEGTLTIKEENIEDDWYHLEIDDGSNTAYTGNWTNRDVNIISDHSEYINLSLDQSTWKPNQVTVTKEGETNQSFWMKKDSGAITKEKKETIKIDKTAPKVKGIKAKDTNNKLQDIINKLTAGIFFKPGTAFEITTDDSKDNLKVSGTKEIAYKVYQLSDGTETEIKNGTLTVTNEKASITISETTGKYKVCVIPTDNAGNTNTESCHEVELKKIDVDVDNDGKLDFNDPDGDGCPDLNIKWKDPNDETKWIVINGDRDGDGIPDLNIDSDGDGKADLNVDTDNDGKPDLNLVILKKTDWKPTKCVKADPDNEILEEYCTGTSVKPVINVDIDGDRIPDINIDTTGDMKADINIDTDGDNKANVNIASPHTEWKPNKDYSYGKPLFNYDTINKYEPLINIDTDGDGRPDLNIDLDGDGVADINIDTDGDRIPNINIDSTGDGKPDINVDLDDDGKPDENIKEITEWKPNKNIDGDLPYDTMEFDKSNDPDEPTNPDEPKQPTDLSDDKDVKGYYYPGKNVGGAITGDETDMLFLCILNMMSLGILMKLYKQEFTND